MGKKKKIKTRKAARKRFKVTGTGKIKHFKPFRRHLLGGRNSSRKRRLRKATTAGPVATRVIRTLLGT